jgi:hypothetical protein
MNIKKIITHLRNHFFFYTTALLVVAFSISSYSHFIANNNYLIKYEGACDPITQKCFVGCEDEACTNEYYYTKMQKYEPDLYAECGADISDCENASVCLSNDRDCSITYCDNKTKTEDETCTSSPDIQNNENNIDFTTEKFLQNDNINNKNI